MQDTKLFDELLVWLLTGIVGAGLWVGRKVFGMNERIMSLEAQMHSSNVKHEHFEDEYKHTISRQEESISKINTDIASMSADLRNTTKNTDRILQLLERK